MLVRLVQIIFVGVGGVSLALALWKLIVLFRLNGFFSRILHITQQGQYTFPDPAPTENLPASPCPDFLNLESESLVTIPEMFSSISDFEDVTDLRHEMAGNRSLVLDGLDIGYSYKSNGEFSVEALVAATDQLKKMGHDVLIIVPGSYKSKLSPLVPSIKELYENQMIMFTPKTKISQTKSETHEQLLMFIMAEQKDAIIVTNCRMKSFLEIHNPLHPEWTSPHQRLLGFQWDDDYLQLTTHPEEFSYGPTATAPDMNMEY